MYKMHKHRLKATLAVAAMIAASSWSVSAQESDSLVVYHQLSAEQIIPIRENFSAHYAEETGRALDFMDFFQPGGQLESTIILEARGNAVRADIIIMPPDGMLSISQSAPDLLSDYRPSNIDDPEIFDSVRHAAETSPGTIFYMATYGIAYNTERLTGDEIPTSWLDALDPRFKNQIGIGDLEQTGGSRAPLWFLVKKMGDDAGDPPWGWSYYDALGEQEPRLFSNHGQLLDNIASGELLLGFVAYSTTFRSAVTGVPVAAVLPVEGAGAQPTSVALVRSSEDNVSGQMFIDWLLSAEGQQVVYDAVRAEPIRHGVEVEAAPFEFDITSPTIGPVDPNWIFDHMEENVLNFREAMGS